MYVYYLICVYYSSSRCYFIYIDIQNHKINLNDINYSEVNSVLVIYMSRLMPGDIEKGVEERKWDGKGGDNLELAIGRLD